ncbi:hypothetical protein EDD37DRAFT_336753 [Exophiala viscosa]|uniref:uncharacterized protein n=1 Tax=Exophiala viscosa TaxID=2486360 RepID=UPI0021A0C2B5|nr:hypothetical protein EDD37DRAFT_336753 [Exophiala viscosa]
METPIRKRRHSNMQAFSSAFDQNPTSVTSSPSEIGSHLPSMIDPSLTDANAYQYVTELPNQTQPESPTLDDFSMFSDDTQFVDMMKSAIGDGEESATTHVGPVLTTPETDDPAEFIRDALSTKIVIPEGLEHAFGGKKSVAFEEWSPEKKNTSSGSTSPEKKNTSNGKTKSVTPKAAATPRRASNGQSRSPVKASPQTTPTRRQGPSTSSPTMPPPAKRVRPNIEQLFANRTPIDDEALLADFNAQQGRPTYQIIPTGSLSAYFRDAKAHANFKWLNRTLDDPEPPPSQLCRQTGYDFPVPAVTGMLTMKSNQKQPTNNPGVTSIGGPVAPCYANLFPQFETPQAQLPAMQNQQLNMQPPRTPIAQQPQTRVMQTVATPATPRSGPAYRFTSAQVQSRSSTPTPESRRVLSQQPIPMQQVSPTTKNNQSDDDGSNTTIAISTTPALSFDDAQVETNTAATLRALGADVINFDAQPPQVDGNYSPPDPEFGDIDFSTVEIDLNFDFDSVAWN